MPHFRGYQELDQLRSWAGAQLPFLISLFLITHFNTSLKLDGLYVVLLIMKHGEHLRLRENWQTYSGSLAVEAEQDFETTLRSMFVETPYILQAKPSEFNNIYVDYPLLERDKGKIYNPGKYSKHGISPDFSIINKSTSKRIYVEIKRQDGWVEGKKRSAGRGNAHERFCKYFTPGLLHILQEYSQIHNALPFWIVFQGDITRDPCRVREITCWFSQHTDNFFFWRPDNPDSLGLHFIECIVPLLD